MDEHASSHHVYTHPSKVEHWRHLIEIVALVVAAVWGFYVFVYQERIKPANEAPNIDFHFDVSRQYVIGNRELAKVSLVWRNTGSTEAQIDGFAENIYGSNYGEFGTQLRPVPAPFGWKADHTAVPTVVESRAMPAHYTLIETWFKPWHPMGGYLWADIMPGQQVTMSAQVVLPRNRFAAIVGVAAYCFRRADDHRSAIVRLKRHSDGSFETEALGRDESAAHLNPHCTYSVSGDYAL